MYKTDIHAESSRVRDDMKERFHSLIGKGVKFSNSSDLDEIGLKLLHVIQGAIKYKFAISQMLASIRFKRSKCSSYAVYSKADL